MITFENDFERTFWCDRFAYWEEKGIHGTLSSVYADNCVQLFRERNSKKEPQFKIDYDLIKKPDLQGYSTFEQKMKITCPHGLNFGCDTDTSDVCDSCEMWDACSSQQAQNVSFMQSMGMSDTTSLAKKECPYYTRYGIQYGVDTGKSIACNKCKVYQHCKDAKDFKNIKPV